MTLRGTLEKRFTKALSAAGAPEGSGGLVIPAARPDFGDYQANGVMAAAKKLKVNPRELAAKVVELADVSDLAEPLEIAGPGFINIRLTSDALSRHLASAAADDRLGVDLPVIPQTVVVDYSSPNLAKEMHVGHLRSTIIGDAIVRTLEFLGHRVIRQNHVGDWGTQFGMLIAELQDTMGPDGDPGQTECANLGDLEQRYRAAKTSFDSDPEFAARARRNVVDLQAGDEQILGLWQKYIQASLDHCQKIYDRLKVTLQVKDVRGESDYNDDLPGIIDELKQSGLLKESRGAQCVFLDEFKGKNGDPLPVIVRKTDGGYLYATTDLAAIRYRVNRLNADRILYVTDSRQSLHFRQVVAVAKKAGFAPDDVVFKHVAFGTMQGADGRPFRTRDGGTVKLTDLLDEAEARAAELIKQKNPDLSTDKQTQVAHAVGIGAVKYADLSHNRASDYVFSWDKMLSLTGNTAPYMQYAYARIQSIFRKGKGDAIRDRRTAEIVVANVTERALALRLAQFPEAVEAVAAECLPHLMCNYLFELAGTFMSFYEECPVLKADKATRASRLGLCELTARVIKTGLDLLGIETIEQM